MLPLLPSTVIAPISSPATSAEIRTLPTFAFLSDFQFPLYCSVPSLLSASPPPPCPEDVSVASGVTQTEGPAGQTFTVRGPSSDASKVGFVCLPVWLAPLLCASGSRKRNEPARAAGSIARHNR